MVCAKPDKLLAREITIPRNTIVTYWRLKLLHYLKEPRILESILLDGNTLHFQTSSWNEYWGEIPSELTPFFRQFERIWRLNVESGFSSRYRIQYGWSVLELLQCALNRWDRSLDNKRLVEKLLGFENIPIVLSKQEYPFALMTTTFRNPFLVYIQAQRNQQTAWGIPNLLPLASTHFHGSNFLFYHYRKQRLHKNHNESLLFYPRVNLKARPNSFCGLDALKNTLIPQWDSRVDERAKLMAQKVLVPLLKFNGNPNGVFRILDIGSGDGIFTEKVIANLLKSNVLGDSKIELSLLDVIVGNPNRRSRSADLLKGIVRVDRISCDYLNWLREDRSSYNFIFLFRILHNTSCFHIEKYKPIVCSQRYPFLPNMNEYYDGLRALFPQTIVKKSDVSRDGIAGPVRVFNQSSLVMSDGSSLIRRLCDLAHHVFIEDSDLSAKDLLKHIKRFEIQNIYVYDFTRVLHLSINRIYWITYRSVNVPCKAALLWPK